MIQANIQQQQMIQTTIEIPNKHEPPTAQSGQLGTKTTNMLSQSQINTMYKLITTQQTIPPQLDSKQKLQRILEHVCQHQPNTAHIFISHVADYIRKGWIVLRDHRYSEWFGRFVFGRIRQPLEQQKQYVQNQLGKSNNVVQNKYENKQKIEDNRLNIDQFVAPLAKQLVKQQYNYAAIDNNIRTIVAQYIRQQPNNTASSLWQLPTKLSSKNITLYQYYLHLIQIITSPHNPHHNNAFYRRAAVQGWLHPQSRQYIIKYINYASKCCSTGAGISMQQVDAVYSVCRILQQQNNTIQAALAQWQVVYQLCLSSNTKYQQFKINKTLAKSTNTQNKQYKCQLIQMINQLTPQLLCYLHTQQQYSQLYQSIAGTQPATPNIRYLVYLHDCSLQADNNSKHEHTSRYINSQMDGITKQLINNSYPTAPIIINSYYAITNVCYQIQQYIGQGNLQQQKLQYVVGNWMKMVAKLAVGVGKHVMELLLGEIVEDRQLATIACVQRMQIISQHLSPQCSIIQDNTHKISANQACNILRLLKIGQISISKQKLQQLCNSKNNSIILLMQAAQYLSTIQYNNNYTATVTNIVANLVPAITNTELLWVIERYLPVLLQLGNKYSHVWQNIIACLTALLDAVEKQQKILPYLCSLYAKQKQITNSIFNWGTTVASLSLYLTQSASPLNMPASTPPIISQLIQTKSTIINKCESLLTQLPSPPLLPYLLLIHDSSSSQYRIYNLYQHNNISIKYHEITQHNPHKQPVFDSDFYRNHGNMYMYLECMKIYVSSRLGCGDSTIVEEVCAYIVDNLRQVKKIQSRIIHNSAQFYSILNIWKFIYAMVYYQEINQWLTLKYKEECILQQLLDIAEAGSIHPLVRQYISLIIGKLYIGLKSANSGVNIRDKWRALLISKINSDNQNININVYVPIIFTLGYQMLHNTLSLPNNNTAPKLGNETQEIFQIFIRYISCHHAYIRSIVQYYIRSKMQIKAQTSNMIKQENSTGQQKKQGSFLDQLCYNVWKNDKDCIKIMRNIGIAVEGFKQAMCEKESLEFLGYERVEQYPNQVVFRQLRYDLITVLTKFLNQNKSSIKKLSFTNQVSIINKYLRLVNEGINKKISKLNKLNFNYSSPRIPLVLCYKLPQIIIIATLLEKVHNFGYILRTLHEKKAMLLVPSKQPLQHPQCKQFIPKNSQVEVIEIKDTQVEKFIQLNKKLGYPMIGLEQCAGSVKIEEYKFPQRYMLLLGNQRIGAPASLLNLADVLVQIAQVGKVRSLNVHVSMAICLWQSIINHQK